ncbi:MAG TPA: ribonuclease H-like domain-containing protein [Candidatus Acidoferrum sp.]|nr:ribonuclease H-like domain-containing protein [Candidatus Acidoferrum sp.]
MSHLPGAAIATNRFGQHVLVRNWFSSPEYSEVSEVTLELLSRCRDEALTKRTRTALADPSKWLFLDTETTGLAGGTGTYAFLIGLAWWDAGALQVEQFFMRDFGEEHAILYEVAARLAERPVLVTFNGRSFDWPLLENRYTMTRAIPVPRLAAHLDLLHPARALWKLRLGSVRLVELERHVLDAAKTGWQRQDDVLAALIPQHYFDYLRGGPAEPLAAVIRHNQMDLRGLAALVGKIDELLAPNGGSDAESLDLFGLSRYLQRRGDSQRAHSACTQAIQRGLPKAHDGQARRELALLAKRRGEHHKAAALWHELLKDERNAVHACEQLAVYFERKQKDPQRALEFAQLGLAKLRRARDLLLDRHGLPGSLRTEQRLADRVARLQARIQLQSRATATLLPVPHGPLPRAPKLPA